MTRYFNKESVNSLMPDELKKAIQDLLLFCSIIAISKCGKYLLINKTKHSL